MEKISDDVVQSHTHARIMNMLVKTRKHKVYASFVFFIFAFFFVSPVLSPAIRDNTIYLSWFVPFLDINFTVHFLTKISVIKAKKNTVIGTYILMTIIILHVNYMFLMKILSIVFSVFYLQYSYDRLGFKKLYTAFNINIFIAILQFVLYFFNRRMAYFIGPSNISKLIWKNFATETNTNFYPVFYLPRTCGLSREAGFFAALLCIIILIYIVDSKIRKTKYQKLLFIMAYIVSFSKMSIVLPVMLLIFKYRRQINKISVFKITMIFLIIMGMFVNYLNKSATLGMLGESFIHRLWGYGIIFNKLSIKEFLIGNAHGTKELNINALNNFQIYRELEARGFMSFCGLPVLVIYTGYLGLLCFLILLKSLRVKSSYFLMLLAATVDVDLITATSFVVLAYWLMIYTSRKGLR